MAFRYRPVDRGQRFLLPPDMGEWLPAGHLAWLVIEVVERLDTSVLHARHRLGGVGRRAYDPDMLLALLIYSYCLGVRSSRQIERLCEVDVAYRVICAGDVPDHTTIARFRQGHQHAAQRLFVDVLAICAEAGLARVGVVAVDGTKMAANASMKANRTRAQMEAEVAAMFAQAEATDVAEDRLFGDARGDELPEDLVDRRSRKARLDAALAVVEAQEAARRAEEEAARQARQQAAAAPERPRGRPARGDEVAWAEAALERAKRRAAQRRAGVEARAAERGRKPSGPQPGNGRRVARYEARLERAKARAAEGAEHPGRKPQRHTEPWANVTDPDSRLMRTHRGWVQGYNAQAAVSRDGLIVAATVTQDHNDVAQCSPMMTNTVGNLAAAGVGQPLGTMLFDAGYLSEDHLTAEGPDRLIATAKSWKLRGTAKQQGYLHGDPPPQATPIEAMEHRLRTEQGSRLYGMRQHIAESVFGHTKHNQGIRRFMRNGLTAVDAEWKLIATAYNLLKLHHRPQPLSAT
jgi:transposase